MITNEYLQFKIYPKKQLSLNTFYSGKHWSWRKRQADYWHSLIQEICYANKFTLFKNPVNIIISFNNKFDIDNNSAMAKLIIDGLKGIVIKDDTRKFVHELTLKFYDEDGIKVEILE